MIRVLNKQKCLITLPPVGNYEGKRLLPGVTFCDEQYMEALSGHKGVEHLFNTPGYLEFVEQGEPLIPEGVKTSLAKASVPAALRLIKDAADPEQLTRWLHADEREDVHRAIAERLQQLEARSEQTESPKQKAKKAQGR